MQARNMRRAAGALALVVVGALGLTGCDGPSVLHGQVTASGTGAHPAGVSVEVFSAASESLVATVLTDAEGRYRFGEMTLEPGTYRLRFNREVWQGGANWATADDISVGPGSVITIDPTIEVRTGAMAGAVSLPPGADPLFLTLTLHNVIGGDPMPVSHDEFGAYEVSGLPPGSYRLQASQSMFGSSTYRGTSFTSAPDARVPSLATIYEVLPLAESEVDLAVPAGRSFSAFLYEAEGVIDAYGALVAVDPVTLEPMHTVYRSMSGSHESEIFPTVPVRLLFVAEDDELRTAFLGATPENPLGTIIEPSQSSIVAEVFRTEPA